MERKRENTKSWVTDLESKTPAGFRLSSVQAGFSLDMPEQTNTWIWKVTSAEDKLYMLIKTKPISRDDGRKMSMNGETRWGNGGALIVHGCTVGQVLE